MDHKTLVLPPLDTLRFFEAAARAGSFSAASQALNVTHGAVSRQIAKLEHWVGRRLFERHGRGVSLTPDGQRLFIRTIEAFALISDESDRWVEARGGAPERLISVPLIHDSDTLAWRAWFAAQGLDYRPKRQDRRFEDYNLVLDAAAHGIGVALARPPLVGEALASGRVVRIDERTALNPVAYWLDRPHGRMRAAAAELARRIMSFAGLPKDTAHAFAAE